MRRREFIMLAGGTAVTLPLAAYAQQGKVWRIGYLHTAFLDTPGDAALLEAFTSELSKLGYNEGKNLVIDKRAAEGHIERLPALASELVALQPDAIVAVATPAITAARRATSTIPIVMTPAGDPVGSGFVKSLSHPGANITGLASLSGDEPAKTFEFLHTIVPGAVKIAVLMSANPTHPKQYELASAAAQALGLSTVPIVAATPEDLPRAFQDITQANCDALFVPGDPLRPAIVSLAAAARIPAGYQYREYAKLGGLLSYGPIQDPMWRRSAQYIDKIFKGASPADLPVEQPTRFELVVNLKTAGALGLTIPQSILARADEVIE